MAKKQVDFQIHIKNEAHWRDVLNESNIICECPRCCISATLGLTPPLPNTVLEVYSRLWGPAECFKPQLQRLFFSKMDKCKFCIVSAPRDNPTCLGSALLRLLLFCR
jgi:hypothetical protein